MLEKVISGGQTGADMAGLRAARACGIATGGNAPKGWIDENGINLDLQRYGLVECSISGYPARTRKNAKDADVTIWFGNRETPGFFCTQSAVLAAKKRFCYVDVIHTESSFATVLEHFNCKILNVAGNRESKNPGIEQRTTLFLIKMFQFMGH